MAASSAKPKIDPISPVSLIGRDEMNLAEFPTALVADRRPDGQKTLYFEDEHGRLTITGSDAYGLPTAMDSDVIISLMYLTKVRNNFTEVKVNFSKYEIIKLLNWRDEVDSYKRLDQSFNRWMGVMLVYDKCWWNNRIKCHTDMKIHIIEHVEIIKDEARRKAREAGQTELPLSSFKWNEKFIESCQADNLRQLNLETYFSLKSAVSKRLYRFLGKRFYLQGDWTFDLNEIAFDRVGLSRSYEGNAGKIKEKLQPAIAELEAIGFLRPLIREKRYRRIDRGQWTIRLTRQSPALVAPPQPAPPAASPPPLVAELTVRGVTEKTATDLVKRHPAEAIAAKIEVFDWLMAKQDKRVTKSPAGYLVTSINDVYAQPKGFLPKAECERQAAAKRQKEEDAAASRRRQREKDAADKAERQRINAYRKELTPGQLIEHEAEAITQASAEMRQTLEQTHEPKIRRMLVGSIIDEYIRHLLREAVEPA